MPGHYHDDDEMDRGASTPAPKRDRIKGSEKNAPGSASDAGGGIEVSEATMTSLKTKASEHNDKAPEGRRTSARTLAAVWRRGAGAYSTSHRPGVSRSAWAMARVNAFLKLLRSGSPDNAKYVSDNDLLPEGHPRSSKRAARELGRRDMYDLPEFIIGHLRTALDNLDRAGGGFKQATADAARDGVRTGKWSGQKIITAAAWHARHSKQAGAMRDGGKLTPKGLATLAWGDNGNGKGAAWLERTAERIKREGEMARGEAHGDGIELRRHIEIDGDPLAMADDGTRVVHILRRGPLYDVDSGDKLLDVDDAMVEAVVKNGNALIAAGQTMPVSKEHGIEKGQRGVPSVDTRSYGEILEFIADGDAYARVRWNDLGRAYLSEQKTGKRGAQGDETTVYISPRVMARFAHPDSGEDLGRVVDVISLTTGPRQNRMDPVELSRGNEQINNGPDTGEEKATMADTHETPTGAGVDVLLARGGTEAGALCDALNLSRDASARDIVSAVKAQGDALTKATAENVELARFKADTERKGREAEAVTLLSRHGIAEDAPEFDLYRDALADGGDFADKVRGVLAKRGEVDLARKVGEAFDAAVKRGAFAKGERSTVVELARKNPATAEGIIAMIEARPDGAHVKASPAPGAGASAPESTTDTRITAVELSRQARAAGLKAGAEGSREYLDAYDNHVASVQSAGVTIV